MILHDVAQTAGAFIERSATLNIKLLGQGNLYARDLITVPDWFEKRVRETKVQDVHNGFFSQKVIDAEDRLLGEEFQRDAVELTCRCQIPAERFLDNHSCSAGQSGRAQTLNDCRE